MGSYLIFRESDFRDFKYEMRETNIIPASLKVGVPSDIKISFIPPSIFFSFYSSTNPEQLRHTVPQVHHLLRRRRTVRSGSDRVSSTAEDQAWTQSAPETVRSLQQRPGDGRRLLRSDMDRRRHWEDQQWTARVPKQVRTCSSRAFVKSALHFFGVCSEI